MKRLLWLITLILVVGSSPAISQSTWIRQQSGTLAWLHAVYFVNSNTGWIGGAGGTLLKTADGGNSWRTLSKPTEDSIHDIHFRDEQNGWLLCERDMFKLRTAEESGNYILRTEDGGATWRRIGLGGSEGQSRLVRFAFSENGKAWIFGEAGTLLKSEDYGETWKKQPLVTRFLLLGADFASPKQGCVVGAGVTIIHTVDGGSTWQPGTTIDRLSHVRFNSVSFPNELFGWIVGDSGRIYATIDGGKSWSPQDSKVDVDLRDVKFKTSLEGWAAGTEGTLLHTTDGGRNWRTESTGTRHPLDRVFAASPQRVWAVGFGGVILAYTVGADRPKLR